VHIDSEGIAQQYRPEIGLFARIGRHVEVRRLLLSSAGCITATGLPCNFCSTDVQLGLKELLF
jgi:hypothetical protein